MPLQTRNIRVTIFEVDGDPLAGARIEIKLVGMGNGVAGAVAPEIVRQETDVNGQSIFKLWQNDQALSDTIYEIRSYHPVTGQKIHNGETFRVYDSDADVKDLINLAPVRIDPTAELLAQIQAARAAAEQAVVNASVILAEVQAIRDSIGQGGGTPAPIVPNQTISTVQGISRFILLGAASDSNGSITYVSSSPNLQVSGNMGVFMSNIPGAHTALITATNASGQTGTGTLSITNRAPSAITEYSLPNVQVQAA
jgi:hypothetical protein